MKYVFKRLQTWYAVPLKELTNEKRGGLNSIGLALSSSRWYFPKNLCRPDPAVRGLKLLSNPCFYYWKQKLFSNTGIEPGAYEKIKELAFPRGQFIKRC